MDRRTTVERVSDRELVARGAVTGPAHLVFRAWTTPELMRRWWVPESFGMTFLSCEMDARTGGSYRFVFAHPAAPEPMAFFGRYIEVDPPSRLVWTNEEAEDGPVTTVTFDETDGVTAIVVHDLYPSKAALDAAMAEGPPGAWAEQFEALDGLLAGLER